MSYAISLSGTTVSIASPGPRGVGVPTGGTTGQALVKASNTDYDFTWGAGGGGVSDIVDDTTPQLGGDLDVNGFDIVSVSNGDITINPNGTGSLILNDLAWPASDGTSNQLLKTSGTGILSFFTIGYTDVTNAVGSGAVDCVTETDVTAGSITDVVALTNDQYNDITGGADPNTLYVITDGTTSIADSDDVTITAAATNDFLIYTGSVWEDQTPAQARTALGLGTLATASTITDSYVGHIETPADGTYYLDPKVAEAREITGVYFAWTAGGSPDGDIDVQIGGTSVLSSTGRMNSGSSFTGTIKTDGTEDVAADAVITVVLGSVNGVADVTDLRFSVEYTQ